MSNRSFAPLAAAALFSLFLTGPISRSIATQERERDRGSGIERERSGGSAAGGSGGASSGVQRGGGGERGGEGPGTRIRPPGSDEWTLGVVPETTDTGVRVRDVVGGSPANRAGLERGDVIVNVEGYQVGRVGGRDYPLDRELNLRADSRGKVRLLVQDRRNNRLTNMDVQLERGSSRPPRDGKLSGDVTYRVGGALPRDAQLRIAMVERTLLGKRTIAETTIAVRGAPPHRFELTYPMSQVDSKKQYEVEADILSNGRSIYEEDGTYRVKPEDAPARLTIQMRRS